MRDGQRKTRVDSGVFVVCSVLYAVNRFGLRQVIPPGRLGLFFAGYFNDILVMPVLCAGLSLSAVLLAERAGLSHACTRLFRGFSHSMRRPLAVFSLALAAGLFWEYITPLYRRGSVSDPMDLVMYQLGALFYLIAVRICFYTQREEADMYCNHCGKKVPEDSAYCCYCGKAAGGAVAGEEEPETGAPPREPLSFGGVVGAVVVGVIICVVIFSFF